MSRAGVQTGKCKVCEHPERARLEYLVLAGASLKAVAKRFGLSHGSLHRHMANHVSEAARAAAVRNVLRPGANLTELVEAQSEANFEHLNLALKKLWFVIDAALEAGDNNAFNNAIGRMHENIALASRLGGQWQKYATPSVQNLIISPEFGEVLLLLRSLANQFPEVREQIMHQLSVLERRASEKLMQAKADPPIKPKVLEHKPSPPASRSEADVDRELEAMLR